MSVKGRRAKRTLDAQSPGLRFPQRQAVVSGRGVNPCPEPETRAVLPLTLASGARQAPGIVTRKGAQLDLFAEQLVTLAAPAIQVDLPDADHNQGIDTASFYRIYHEHRFSPFTPEIGWAHLRWSIDGYQRFQVNEVSNRNYEESLRNRGAWLIKDIVGLNGMAGVW